MTTTITRGFKSEKEVLMSRIKDKWSNNYAKIVKASYKLDEGTYLNVSRKHIIYGHGKVTYPIILEFTIRN